MSERNVLASCLRSREAFDKVARYVDTDDFNEQGRIILNHIGLYYDTDPNAQECDSEIVARSIGRELSNPKHRETFNSILQDLDDIEISPANVVKDLLGVKREASGSKLASALAAGRPVEEIVPLIDEYTSYAQGESLVEKEEDRVLRGANLVDLVRTNYSEDALIKVWPKALNDRLDGGCLPGHHIVVFARPEAGKTLMLINMMAGFLSQGLTCLYVGNEDPIMDIVVRTVARLNNQTKYEVLDDPEGAYQQAMEKGYENMVFAALAPGTPREIESLVLEHEPQVVLIDQLRNLNVGEEHFVQKLEKAATAARNIAKRHDVLVISATQAGDSATGKAVLDQGDVDSSNTGIPAQADVMIGIGGTHEDFSRDRRIISLPKNKRSGNHEFFPIQLIPQLSKIRSVE